MNLLIGKQLFRIRTIYVIQNYKKKHDYIKPLILQVIKIQVHAAVG